MPSWLFSVPQPPAPAPTSNWQIFAIGLSVLATVVGGGALFYIRETRRKILAEARKLEVEPEVLLSEQAMRMLDRIETRLVAEEAKSARLEAKNDRLEEHVRALEEELRRHEITPPQWPPLRVVDDV